MTTKEHTAHQREISTACILCSENCGLRVTTEVGVDNKVRLTKVRGDEAHPSSGGYLCQKAARLNHYQNHADRLDTPLRRRPDGSFEPIDWDTAIQEIAAWMREIKQKHGGEAFAYYGGGGQGNHLGGVYSAGLRAALGTRYLYTALAQEKTGDFWVNGKLFGRQTCHVTTDIPNAEVVLFIGTNPWQSHGFPEARKQLTALSKDPERCLIVVDPIRTDTARLADHFLQLRPSSDAWLMAGILKVWLDEDLVDTRFLEAHTTGLAEVQHALGKLALNQCAEQTGIDTEVIQTVARRMASAKSCCIRADLGLQQSLHSTLNSYLEKLLFLLSGNFAKPGGNNLHTYLMPLLGHSDPAKAWRTKETKVEEIGKLFPPNVLPQEILSEREDRVRALIVDSANPLRSGADTPAYEKACKRLELMVVIDVAMTETAAQAHYVLPASSQFEKWEATFFNLGFPKNHFHLRKPFIEPLKGTLPEPEIYQRLVVALGAMPARLPWLERIAKLDRKRPQLRLFPLALAGLLKLRPQLMKVLPNLLYSSLGPAMPEGAKAAAVLWGAATQYATKHRAAVERAGIRDRGAGLGEALFEAMLRRRSGMELSHHAYSDVWSMIRHADGKVHLAIPELLRELAALSLSPQSEAAPSDAKEFPFTLIAGQRRSYNANTIYRDPNWRRNDPRGALRLHPEDAATLGIADGEALKCESARGSIEVSAELDATLQPGLVVLPHGYGLNHPDASGARTPSGPGVNYLTSSAHCDPLTRTPYHKHVAVRLSRA
ncbi:MAG: molybdopterin-dependent oxidoreductase [Myxococcales bacterium]|nr:molybdopterin-dependent oxidoreductase [Myxococcales bacterium]MCB9606749.1 molybdopterin-dependent oxidoreductase [Polyangiaceae bacterium]